MTAGRTLTEEEAANGLYSSLVVALKVAKHACVLDETDLLVGGDEQWLIIYGLSLYFMYSAKFDATLLSIVLPCLEDSDRRLNASTCPPAFRPYFDRWVDLVPRIQPLSEDYTQDLALLICRKPPITLPKELPDPLPFFLTPEQQAREDIRELSSGLRVISNAISEHASFSPLWRGKLYAALREEDQTITDEQIPAVITGDMKVHQIFTILTQHSCRDVTNELDFPSCSIYPSAAGGTHDIYTGRLRDGSLVAIKKPQMRSAYMRDEDYIVRAACGTYTWSEHHHSNVLPLIGLAYSSGELATISPWMRNGNILDYVNKHEPDADRFNLCTQIACGLAYLHSVGIVHGNVTGANILVSDSGVPMLGGFSNSVPLESTIRFPEMEGERSISVRWAAPELFESPTPSMAADVYALGMVILEVFTGQVPYYYIERHFDVINAVTVRKVIPNRPLDEIPPNDSQGDMLWTLLRSCWRCDPAKRRTAEQVYKTMKPFVIDCTMAASEIIAHLGSRNCPNLTDQLNDSLCSQYPLSTGGYGDVYRGALKSGESIALKSIIVRIGSSGSERELLKDIARELYVWSKCNHENVVKLLGLAMFRNQIAMVSPWMESGNLAVYIKRNTSVDRCQLCIQVAHGLAYLHEIEMVHGDLKAANVLVSDQGVAMLTDFGNAVLSLSTVKFVGTETGCKISVRWTAPELMSDGAKYSRQADVYALGMTILETLTGEVPFGNKRDDRMVICAVFVKKRPGRPECIPSGSRDGDRLWSLLVGCWSHERAERPTASEVQDMMQTITKEGLLPPK